MYFMSQNMNSKVLPGEETAETAGSWAGRWLTLQCGNFCWNSTYRVGECKFWQQEGLDTRHLKTTWYLILLCLKANITLNVCTKFRPLGWDVVKQNKSSNSKLYNPFFPSWKENVDSSLSQPFIVNTEMKRFGIDYFSFSRTRKY